jgi:hypothetical protein
MFLFSTNLFPLRETKIDKLCNDGLRAFAVESALDLSAISIYGSEYEGIRLVYGDLPGSISTCANLVYLSRDRGVSYI